MHLSITTIIVLFVYYVALCVTGAAFAIRFVRPGVNESSGVELLSRALFASAGMAILGNSIYYIRKLYKACIQERIDATGGTSLARIGAAVYYFSRPLFSLGFAILIVVGTMSGDLLVSGRKDITSESFIHVCMFLSFFAGFAAGNFIKYLEFKSDSVIEKLRRAK